MKSNKKQITNCERKTKKNLFAKQNTKEDNKEKKILLNIVKHENSTTKIENEPTFSHQIKTRKRKWNFLMLICNST